MRHLITLISEIFTITTDRDGNSNLLWKYFMRILDSEYICATAYNPTSNELLERFHRQLKLLFQQILSK